MYLSSFVRRSLVVAVGLVLSCGVVLVGCDLPTGQPSFETETDLSAPLVSKKTFSFLGGPTSANEPLIDTTTTAFDSLFSVGGRSEKSIFIQETLSSFEVGEAEGIISEAAGSLELGGSIEQQFMMEGEYGSQAIDVQEIQSTGIFESEGIKSAGPLGTASNSEDTIHVSFPTEEISAPTSGTFSVPSATLHSAQLTQEQEHSGSSVNVVTVTVKNGGDGSPSLTDGDGRPPSVALHSAGGDVIAQATYDQPIPSGSSESVVLSIGGAIIDQETSFVVTIDGGNPTEDEIVVSTSRFRYGQVTLDDVEEAHFQPDTRELAIGTDNDLRLAGATGRDGTLRIVFTNQLSFPISVESLQMTNRRSETDLLPDGFPKLDISESAGIIQPGAQEEFVVDLAGRGMASAVNLDLRVTSQVQGNRLTVESDGSVGVRAKGNMAVERLYFWPAGSEVHAGSTFDLETEKIRFERGSDFVEVASGSLQLTDLVNEAQVGLQSFAVSFPDFRLPPYAAQDSLVIRFTDNPSGKYEFSPIGAEEDRRDVDVPLDDVRLSPVNGKVRYHVGGTVESLSNPTAENLRSVHFEDQVRTDMSVENVEVRALEAGIAPFSVPLTDDANGDGRLDLEVDEEVTKASISALGGFADQVQNLQVDGSQLTFSVTTDARTNFRLFGALRGQREDAQVYLGGRAEYGVSANDSLASSFYEGGSQIGNQNLFQIGLEGARSNELVTRSVSLTDENSSVDELASVLPTSFRFAAQTLVTGDDEGRIAARRPVSFDAGLNARIPVQFEGSFTVRDTVDADLSALDDLTNPGKEVTVSSAELEIGYENAVPIGSRVHVSVLDVDDNVVLELPSAEETVEVLPAAKSEDGTTAQAKSGTVTLTLTESQLRTLAEGKRLLLRLTMTQQDQGSPAAVRATDTIELSLRTDVNATVSTGD